MKNGIGYALNAMMLFLSLAGQVAAQDQQKEKITELEKKVDKQQAEIDALKDDLRKMKDQPAFLQPFHLQIFGGATAVADNRRRSDNTFKLGEVDLFAQGDLGKGLSSLMEIVFEADDETNEWSADPERLTLTYGYSDELNFSVGKYHVPLGYWNDQFHHGVYMQTPIFRPRMFNFEDHDGIMPIHTVGVKAYGKTSLLRGLSYAIYTGNGRAEARDGIINVRDNNGGKSLGGTLEYSGFELFRLGGSAYRDRIDTVGFAGEMVKFDENIFSAYATHDVGHFSMIIEGFSMRHQGGDLDAKRETTGGYVLASYAIGDFTPYLLFERNNFAGDDPYLADLQDVKSGRIGLRWDFHPNAALKVEYDHTSLADDGNASTDDRYGSFLMNVCFYF